MEVGTGSTTWTLACAVEGTLTVKLDVTVDLFIASNGAGPVDFEYTVNAVNPDFLLGGVASDMRIVRLEAISDITNAFPPTSTAVNSANVPDVTLENFLVDPTPLPPAIANEILRAVNPDPTLENVCGQVAGSTCTKGPIPQGIDLATEEIVPSAPDVTVGFNWSGSLLLNILAVDGSLPIDFDTADPEICTVLTSGAPVELGATAN